jgi:hypothetical protein
MLKKNDLSYRAVSWLSIALSARGESKNSQSAINAQCLTGCRRIGSVLRRINRATVRQLSNDAPTFDTGVYLLFGSLLVAALSQLSFSGFGFN